jgi:phage terminase large subunit
MPDFTVEIVPRAQFRPYLERSERWACMVVHRRGGKTYCCLQDLLLRGLNFKRPGPPLRFAYIAPTRDQAKDIAWGYLTRFVGKIPGCALNQADLCVTLPNAAQIRLYSGDNYERMRGLYFDGAVIDEPADIDPDAWHSVIRACLSDYNGWATFIGTPKGRNAFYDRWVESTQGGDWFSFLLRASESGIISDAELASIRSQTPEHIYRQEYECDFTVPIPGAVYAAAIDRARSEGRITSFPIDGSSLVHTSWDLGAPQNTVVWYWQIVGREVRIIDCDRNFEGTLTERVAAMLRKGYNFGKHYLPHDAMQTERSGTTLATELHKCGLLGTVIVPRTHDVWVGINHALEMFPALAFRSPQCDSGLDALSSYRTRRQGEGALTTDEPVHDWASHPADAFRVMAEGHRAGLWQFKNTTAEVRPDWYGLKARNKRGMKPQRVS